MSVVLLFLVLYVWLLLYNFSYFLFYFSPIYFRFMSTYSIRDDLNWCCLILRPFLSIIPEYFGHETLNSHKTQDLPTL